MLPPAPRAVVNELGHPRFGTYQGGVEEVDLSQLGGAFQLARPLRIAKHKRWLYSFVATPEVIALSLVADLTYTANAFVLVVDRSTRKVLVEDGFLGLPPLVEVGNRPGEGAVATFRALGARFDKRRPPGEHRYRIDVKLGRLRPLPRPPLSLEAELLAAGGPPPLTVIAPVPGGGVVNVTQKWAGLLSFGTLEAGGRRYLLDGGVGGLDYTHGYLARNTAWRWAFACGRLDDGTPVGLNLVEGFNEASTEANENALWLGRRLIPLGRARFSYNPADPLDEWTVRTVEGAVELRFRPIAAHREQRDLKLVRSRFVQPVGTFAGTLRVGDEVHSVRELPGVTEDQDILW